MPLPDRPEWIAARKARLAAQFPVEFGSSDAHTVIGVDAQNMAAGQPPSQFAQAAMRLAANAGKIAKP